jgi:hypothetical protein
MRDWQVSLLKGGVQEQLKCIGTFLAFVDTAAIKSLRDFLEYLIQVVTTSQSTSNKNNLLTDGFGCFDHTSAWNRPTAYNHHPMHDHHPNQLGIEVAEQVPGVLAARHIYLPILLPQLEEQRYLPSCL